MGQSGRFAAMCDEIWEMGHGRMATEIVPEGDADSCAGFGLGIAAIAAGVTTSSAADVFQDLHLSLNGIAREQGAEA